MVTISGPIGGVLLGTNLSATVIILKNDDINGVFSFDSGSIVVCIFLICAEKGCAFPLSLSIPFSVSLCLSPSP